MPEIRVQITGIPDIEARLKRIDGIGWAVRPMEQSTRHLQRILATYPRQRAGTTYRRTGTLGRAWTVGKQERTANSLTQRVGNKTEYAPWVQSRQFQADIHRGLWRTEYDVVESERETLAGFFQTAIAEASR